MDQQRLEMYLMTNAKNFPSNQIMYLKDRLAALDDNQFMMVSSMELKDPNTMLIISIFLGTLGIDRFMLNDVGMGVLKLLTGGCCGVLTIIDWFMIMDKTREYNFMNIMNALNYYLR
ncbi:MAG: TM2 domain-containing protein [Anaerofustis sp.]